MSTWRNPNPTPVQLRHREAQRKVSAAKRKLYLTIADCPRCGEVISVEHDCSCKLVTLQAAQYRDVVLTLNVKTMTKKIEVR